ncbi:zinc finger protein ZAT9-like [Senna tora]|uniref:Zinc finger protein ZAT9-like n=1 Tax=Senna tora TaxID=362788 RepID=A0A834SMP2_9FABA|nr:zinc finger protein ZAT9-like [Senna tora]
MGGHMRSHFAKLPIPPKPFETTNDNDDVVSAPPHDFDAAGKNFCSLNRDFCPADQVHDDEDGGESESDEEEDIYDAY